MNSLHMTLGYGVWFLITFFFMVSFLTLLRNRRKFYKIPRFDGSEPLVSIVIPAFNEEKGIADTIESVLNVDYPRDKLEVIVVNDGSKDRTGEIIESYGRKVVYLKNRVNIGKALSLNRCFEKAKGRYVACIDADTVVEPDVIKKTLGYFRDKSVAAVVVRIRVREPKNWLEKIIAVEYMLGLGFYPKIFSFLNCLYLTPGQFSIYRRDKVLEIGGFDKNNIVEDTEIAYRFQKARYKIACCTSTSASTRVPNNLRALYYQRKRWYTGTLQTVLQHKDVFFNRRLGNFGLYFMPFNYGTVLFALLLLLSTAYLILDLVYVNMLNYNLIGFDFLTPVKTFFEDPDFDPLRVSTHFFYGFSPFLMNLAGCFIGLKYMGERVRKNLFGFVVFLFFFIPYQMFWWYCIYLVAFKKEVKWRESM